MVVVFEEVVEVVTEASESLGLERMHVHAKRLGYRALLSRIFASTSKSVGEAASLDTPSAPQARGEVHSSMFMGLTRRELEHGRRRLCRPAWFHPVVHSRLGPVSVFLAPSSYL